MEAGGSQRLPEQPLTWQLPPPQRHRASGQDLPSGWAATGHPLPEVLGHREAAAAAPSLSSQMLSLSPWWKGAQPASHPLGAARPGVAPHAACSPWPCAFLQPGRVCVGALGAPGASMCPPGLIPHCQKARLHGEGQPWCCCGALIPGRVGRRHLGLGIVLSQPAPAPVSSVPKASLAGME